MRLFLAVELSTELKQNIGKFIEEWQTRGGEVRWVDRGNLHLTLKFLGEVEEGKLAEVTGLAQAAAAGSGSLKIKVTGAGFFPRVIWVGITEGAAELKKLAAALEHSFAQAGYRAEGREFSSHITIGRVKKGISPQLKGITAGSFGEMTVDHLSLIKSTLTPQGPIYETIKEVKL